MNYLFCPDCGKVQPGAVTRFDHIICSQCGRKLNLRGLDYKLCPDCGNILYAPGDRIERLQFPCSAEHASRKENAVGSAPAEVHDERTRAAVNGVSPADEKTDREDVLTAAESTPAAQTEEEGTHASQTPLQIKWDPAPGDLIHIHPCSSAIPPYSVLIVRENQEAVYCAGGAMQTLSGGRTYPLFDDPRTEEEIIEGIYQNNSSKDSLDYRLDTKIIFVSKYHDLLSKAHIALPGDTWEAELPCDIGFRVCETELLLRNPVNLRDEAEFARTVTQSVEKAVVGEINARFLDISEERAAEVKTEGELKRLSVGLLQEETAAICQRVNQRLVPHWGIRVSYLDMDFDNMLCRNIRNSVQEVCPYCGHKNWIEKGSRKAYTCAECRTKLSWCIYCKRFTKSRRLLPDECAECGYIRIH